MSQPVLVKVYGGFKPAAPDLAQALESEINKAIPSENAHVSLAGDLCALSFEGIYFPLDEILEAIERHATSMTGGRLDVLDLENWRLYRHEIADGKMEVHQNNLDNVLDYSGF